MARLLAIIAFLLWGPLPGAPAAPEGGELPLTLTDCFQRALSANLDLQVERLNPLLSATEITRAEAFYDFRLRTDAQYGESNAPRSAEQVAADGRSSIGSQTTSLNASVLQRLPPGTELGLTTNTRNSPSTFTNFRDEWSSFSGLTLAQPLLRNFGSAASLAQLRIARRGLTASAAALQYRVEQIITEVANAYYELIFSRDFSAAQKESLRLAEQLLGDNQARVEIGVMSPLEVSQANAEVATRREEVLTADRSVRDRENALRRLISSDVASLLSQRLLPLDLPPRDWSPATTSYDIAQGLAHRADYRQAYELFERNKLDEAFRKNQLLPQLNLRGQYGFAGLDRDLDVSYNDVVDTTDPQWFAGLTLEIPFQNREGKSAYAASTLRRRQQELLLKRIEQDIIVQIDNAAGQTETNRQRIVAARTARLLAEETLAAEENKLKAGVSTSYLVLQLQRDLANTRVNELRAVADYQKSLAELVRTQGQSLPHFQIELKIK
jgi:outer membrane protein